MWSFVNIISCLKCTVNSNFHLIRSKTLPTNDFELTVPDLYYSVDPNTKSFNYMQIWLKIRNTTLNYGYLKLANSSIPFELMELRINHV